jgi:hypothetical protein
MVSNDGKYSASKSLLERYQMYPVSNDTKEDLRCRLPEGKARTPYPAVWTFTEGRVRHFAPRKGWRTQPRVSTLGTDQPERRALKGRQIECPNKVEVGVQWPIVTCFNGALTFRAAMGCEICSQPHVTPLQGEPFILRVPRVETLG